MLNKLKKIIVSGYELFWQEKTISLVNIGNTILVSVFIWAGILSFYFLNQMINYLKERLDFSIYFRYDVSKEDILKVQKVLASFPGVTEVNFIPQEVALKKFQEEAKSNPVIAKALKELQANPLVDYLIVKAENPEVYPKIVDYLEKSPFKAYIDYITYFENQKVIKKIISLSNRLKLFITALIVVILIFSSLIIFNTALISIYSQKEEIEILRLIGAGSWFIRGPFFVNIFIFSFLGYIISLAILILFLIKTENFWPAILPNFQPSIFISEHFFMLNLLILGLILLINLASTWISMIKYLKK
jgi:cell division transport system permease protein